MIIRYEYLSEILKHMVDYNKKILFIIKIDKQYRLESVYVFTRYPLLGETLREDGKHNTGMMVYVWFKFNKNYREEPIIRWLDNDSYILKKGDE